MKAKDLGNSILRAAVQGKLVPQDPDDEPASALLERIRAERAKLIAEKKVKAPKGGESVIFLGSDGSRYEKCVDAKGRESEPACIDDEIPFDIPEGWEWARLSTFFTKMGSGSTPVGGRKVYKDEGPMIIRSQNVHNDGLRLNDVAHFDRSLFERRSTHVEMNDMLLNITGASIGRCAIVCDEIGDADVNQHVLIMRPIHSCTNAFMHLAICSWLVQSQIMGSQVGATKEGLSAAKAAALLVPIPPLAEQRRIAERVSELMPLVEEYGELEDEREALDAALPERLRKSVLQMAVEGKLVAQNPSDEPASVLLGRIREDRARLIAEKRIKAPKGGESVIYLGSDGRRYEKRVDAKGRETEPACIDDEIPFDIPEDWEWARFETVLFNRDAERIPVSVADREKLEKRYDYYGASGVIDKVDGYLFDKPLLLIGEDGANLLARTKPIAFVARGHYWVNNHAHVLDGISEILLEYVALFINSISLAPYVTGTAQPKMNQAKMNTILIPLPPKGEQSRILEKATTLDNLITNQ